MELVPVRRDGTGRLAAVGLIEVLDTDGIERWSIVSMERLPGETLQATIERGLNDNLGPDAHGQLSDPPRIDLQRGRRAAREPRPSDQARSSLANPSAVEVWGTLRPRGLALRFNWFLVTALPAKVAILPAMRRVLADFLEDQGEAGLAVRLRQF